MPQFAVSVTLRTGNKSGAATGILCGAQGGDPGGAQRVRQDHPEYAREYYLRNKGKMLEYGRQYREQTRREYAREYYRRNKEKMLESSRKYREDTHPEYTREYYLRNRKKMLEYGRKYREGRKAKSPAGG